MVEAGALTKRHNGNTETRCHKETGGKNRVQEAEAAAMAKGLHSHMKKEKES